MRLSLQWKILAGYLAVAGVGLGVAGWLSLERFEASDMKQLQAGLTAQARLAAEIFAAPLAGISPDVQAIDALADRLGEAHHFVTRVVVVGERSADVLDADGAQAAAVEEAAADLFAGQA